MVLLLLVLKPWGDLLSVVHWSHDGILSLPLPLPASLHCPATACASHRKCGVVRVASWVVWWAGRHHRRGRGEESTGQGHEPAPSTLTCMFTDMHTRIQKHPKNMLKCSQCTNALQPLDTPGGEKRGGPCCCMEATPGKKDWLLATCCNGLAGTCW